MSRAIRQQRGEAGATPSQIENLAFNVRGHAMHDGMKRQSIETICAYAKIQTGFKVAITKAIESGTDEAELFKIDAAYTQRELGEPEINVKQYLVVGYTPRQTPDDIKKMEKGQKKQSPVGTHSPENIIPWDSKAPPVLVVAEILQQQPEGIKLLALLNPKNGLCTPHPISNDIVFYRYEFRDATHDIKKRGPNWNALVAQHSIRPGIAAPLSAKQEKFKRAKDSTKLVFSANISLCNEIANLAAGFYHTPNLDFMMEIKDVLRAISNDINYRPAVDNGNMRVFVENEEEIDEDVAAAFVEEFQTMWPQVGHVTAERVRELKAHLVALNIELEYRLIKPFIQEACWQLAESNLEHGLTRNMVLNVVQTARRWFEPHESAARVPEGDLDALLATILAKLKEIVAAGEYMEQQMKDSLGDVAFGRSTYDVWGEFGETADTDTARAAFFQIARVLTASVLRKEMMLRGMVEDLVDVLGKLNFEKD